MDDVPRDSAGPSGRPTFNLFAALWKHRLVVVLGVVVGGVLGGLHYARKQPAYLSATQVLVVKKRSDALPVGGGDPRLGVYDDYVSTHLVLIRSPFVLERAVRKRSLAALRSFQNTEPVGAIQGGLVATRDRDPNGPPTGNNIILLSFRGPDPGDAEVVLNAIVDSYRDFLDETYRNVSDNTLDLITRASELLKTDLNEKEQAYATFRKTSPLMVRSSEGVNVHTSRILDLQKRETLLLERGGEIKERLRAIDDARKAGRPADIAVALATRPLDKVGAQTNTDYSLELALHPLLLKEQDLLSVFGKDHPDVKRIRQQIDMTRTLYAKLDTLTKKGPEADPAGGRLDSHVQALGQELILVETVHKALTSLLKDEFDKARALEVYEVQDQAHRNDIARTAQILNGTLKRLEEINLVRDFGGFEAKVIAPPGRGAKVSPILSQFLLLGLVIGAILGCTGAVLLDITDKSFHSAEDIRHALRLPIIGHVPYRSRRGAATAHVDTPDGPGVEVDAGLSTVFAPLSAESESFRGIRTALYFNTRGERHKVLQVTSPNAGDGKTTVISNLAVAIAQSGRSVVLVDADLRRPRVHRVFGLSNRVGLAEAIGGSVQPADVIQPTVVPNLSVLTSGRRVPNPAELLTSPEFDAVLDDLREAYDFVLVDTPPLLGVSDPCAVAPRVDGLILVIRVMKNGRPSAMQARGLLDGLSVQLLGAVVNGVGRDGAMSGYGYGHYEYSETYTSNESEDRDAVDDESPDGAAPRAKEPSANGHA